MITTLEPGDIIICTKLQTDEKSFSDTAWLSGAVLRISKNEPPEIYTNGITIGNEYRVDLVREDTIYLKNDHNGQRSYLNELFESKSNIREQKLKELGI